MMVAWLACRPSEPERPAKLDDILAAVPDSGMRERWRTAAAEGRLPAEGASQLSLAVLPDTAAAMLRGAPGAVGVVAATL